MIHRGLLFLSAAIYAMVTLLACNAVASEKLSPVPDQMKPGDGLIVDDCDHSDFFGTFKDTKGSTITAATVDHDGGRFGKFLRVDYDLKPGGFIGMWHKIGMAWEKNQQDWSAATALTFLAYSSRPATVSFTIKGDKGASISRVPS